MHFFGLLCKPILYSMELEDIQRKIQFRQGSYMVTIPLQIIHMLGIRKDHHVKFAVSKNKIVIKPIESNITKKDLSEAEKDSAILDESHTPGYREDLAIALGRKTKPEKDSAEPSRLEKLRMK